MPIDQFDKKRFEAALPVNADGVALWEHDGMSYGEHCYFVKVNDAARLYVRSSMGEDGVAGETGQDSIRMWIEVRVDNAEHPIWKALKKDGEYTTRVGGWEERMKVKMRDMWKKAYRIQRSVPVCQKCGHVQPVWFVKKEGANQGRPCSKCINDKEGFVWLDEVEPARTAEAPPKRRAITEVVRNEGDSGDAPESTKQDDEQTNSWMDEIRAMASGSNVEAKPERGSGGESPTANAQQQEAIEAPLDAACRVFSGPGGGKTFVIERRVDHLIKNGVKPERIVVVTFSKTQSQDMLERIVKHNPDIAGTAAERQICTIHAFCLRELAKADGAYEVPKQWQIKKLCEELAAKHWYVTPGTTPERAIKMRPAWDELMTAFNGAKSHFYAPNEDIELYKGFANNEDALKLSKCRDEFDRTMRSRGWWTFNDMLYDMEWMMRYDEQFRARVQESYEYLILDEGQDTNAQAMRILTMVAAPHDNFYIVGDNDQLLFRFAGATPEHNLQEGFSERYKEKAETYLLETNYRSTKSIVDACNDLIENNYQINGGPYDEMFHKTLNARPDAPIGEPVTFREYDGAPEEAQGTAEEILTLMRDGYEAGDFFVLARTRAQLGYLEGPLTRAGIPFINLTGGSFWLLRHVKQMLGYVRVIVDPENSEAFEDIFNVASNDMTDRDGNYCSTRWLGHAFLDRVRTYDVSKLDNVARRRRSWTKGVDDLIWMVEGVREQLENEGLRAALQFVMDDCMKAYLIHQDGVSADDASTGKLADLASVIDIAHKFGDAKDFLERVDEAIQSALDAKNKNWDKYVVLSTVHRIKGMERKVAFTIGLSEGEESGLLPHTFSLVDVPSVGYFDFGNFSPVEDERCIAFVAISRAKEVARLSGIREYRDKELQPSRFVDEMGLY